MKKSLLTLIIAFVCLCALPGIARATILFRGGEDSDLICFGTCAINTNSAYFDGNFSRENMYITSNGSDLGTPTFTPASTLWIHTEIYLNRSNNPGAAYSMISALSPDGVNRLFVGWTSTSWSTLGIYSHNAAGTSTLLATATNAVSQYNKYAIDFYINYGTSGEAALYVNGAKVADYTGDVTTDGATQINQVKLDTADYNNGSAAGQVDFSQVIVATTSTIGWHLATLVPAANGNTDNWDVGGVANINESTLNDVTLNASGTAGQVQEYTIGTLPTGTYSVVDVAVNMRAAVGSSGPQHLDGMVRTGGTDYTSADLAPPPYVWSLVTADWPTNPNTGVAWTTTDLGTAGFNVGFKSAN